MKAYLGVDIGGTSVKLGLVDEGGALLRTSGASVSFDGYRTPLLETVLEESWNFWRQDPIPLAGIGVAATGQIDVDRGTVIGVAGHIPGWLGSPIKERMEERFGVGTEVLNDANAVALAEQRNALPAENVLVVTIGTGVGGGILDHGRLIMGSRGIGGEIGHFPIDLDGELCSCGNRGCLERYGSTLALVRAVQAHPALAEWLGEVNGVTIFQHVEESPLLAQVVDGWTERIAAGIVGLVHIFNPELVLVGGGVSAQEERFIRPLREKVLSRVMPRFGEGLELRAASLGNNAGMLGAVAFYRQRREGLL